MALESSYGFLLRRLAFFFSFCYRERFLAPGMGGEGGQGFRCGMECWIDAWRCLCHGCSLCVISMRVGLDSGVLRLVNR